MSPRPSMSVPACRLLQEDPVPAASCRFTNINSLEDLKAMSDWTETSPLRVVTGYQNIARKFFSKHGFEHVVLLSADGALEAAPLMGSADIILDLVSTGKLGHSCMMLHSAQAGLGGARH